METVKAGRSEPWYMLDNAEACLAVLRDVEARLAEVVPMSQPDRASRSTPMTFRAITRRRKKLPLRTSQRMPKRLLQEQVSAQQMAATEVMPLPVVSPDAEHMDPEILELFIEEAKEEINSIQRHLPAWLESPDSMEMLITVRRSFHTLEGQWTHGGCGAHR